jgi:hypothetical protein
MGFDLCGHAQAQRVACLVECFQKGIERLGREVVLFWQTLEAVSLDLGITGGESRQLQGHTSTGNEKTHLDASARP